VRRAGKAPTGVWTFPAHAGEDSTDAGERTTLRPSTPNLPPPQPRQPPPGELLWEIHGAGRWHRCELRDHGEWGTEAQIFSDTNELIARRFDTREQAIRWAAYERADLERR
jgi:hypothetical protein